MWDIFKGVRLRRENAELRARVVELKYDITRWRRHCEELEQRLRIAEKVIADKNAEPRCFMK